MITRKQTVKKYTVTAGVLNYNIPFPIYESGDVLVVWSDNNEGFDEHTLTLGSDYGVTINSAGDGGTVTLKSDRVPIGAILAVVSNIPETQELSLSHTAEVDTKSTEKELDRQVQMIQQLSDAVNRCVKVGVTSGLTPDEMLKAVFKAYHDILESLAETGSITGAIPVVATGTTEPRSLKDRFADIINVKDFGAKGDGVTDDTASIQAALNAASVFRGDILENAMNYVQNCVFFPAGTYIISDTLFVGEGTTVFGASQSSSIIKATHSGIAIQCGNTDRYYSQINIIRLSIVGDFFGDVSSYDFTTNTTVGIQFVKCVRNCSVSECLIFGCYTNIKGIYSWTLNIYNNIIQYSKTYLIHLDNGNNVCIAKNRLDKSGGNGIYIEKIDGYTTNCLEIKDNAIQYCWGNGVLLESCYQATFSGNDFENNGRGSSTPESRYADVYIAEHPSASTILGVFTFLGNLHTVNDSYERTNFTAIVCEKAYSINIFNEICLSIKDFLSVDYENTYVNTLGNRIKNPDYPDVYFRGSGPTKIFSSNLKKLNTPEKLSFAFRIIAKDKDREDIGYIEENIDTNGNSYLRFRVPNFSSSYEESFLYIVASENNNYATLNGNFRPNKDNTYYAGLSSYRWKEIFAANSTINTSDQREKQHIEPFSDEVLDAWGDVQFRQFLFNDAVEKKGEYARIHSGVIAQQVRDVFTSHGLDATHYGLLCYDEWEDQYEDIEIVDADAVLDADGNEIIPEQKHTEKRLVTASGSRYGIRYAEALCLEAAYQRRRADRIETRLATLEAKFEERA